MAFCDSKLIKIFLPLTMFVAACAAMTTALRATAVGAPSASTQAPNAARPVGTIKSVSGNNLTLATDAGGDVTVVVQEGAKLLRVEPGQKDLKEAVPISLQELLSGDRILVRGQLAQDGKTVLASGLIAMKKASIAEKQAHEREEWRRKGVGGLVSSVDPAANSIVITQQGMGEKKAVTIRLAKDTILRRYAPYSVKFDDAKPARLEEIKPGDQLRARGARSADGSELAAAEIVCGTFRNIAGTISSIDASANTITVEDLATKKSVTVHITADSQVRKLPLQMAQGIAMRMKGATPSSQGGNPQGGSTSGGASGAARQEPQGPRPAGSEAGPSGEGGSARAGRGAGGDFQQALSRIPTVTLADLQKGEAVMIVATEGGSNGTPSVITLLAGVETILQASPNSSASSILSPWSLGGGDAGGG